MKSLLLALSVLFMSLTAFAGFEGLNKNVSLKIFSRLDCGTGLTCSRFKDKMIIAETGISPRILATATTITSSQCGSTFYNAGAIQLVLPAASVVIGCQLTFVTLNATNFDVDPQASDIILVQTDAAGDRIRNAVIGNTITIQAVSPTQWAVVGILGTWADAN